MSVLSASSQKYAEEQLIKENLITETELVEYRKKAETTQTPLFPMLLKEQKIDNEQLTKVLAKTYKVPYVKLAHVRIPPDILQLLPQEVAELYMAVTIGEVQNRVAVAMLDANNVQAVDFLSQKIGKPVKVYMASEEGIRSVIRQYGANLRKDVFGSLTEESEAEKKSEEEQENKNAKSKKDQVKVLVQDSPISKALSAILDFAARNRASDIHIEPLEHELKIRCRIDGVLTEIMKLPKSTEPALVSRVKILANLKIDEHRIPQDGQFTVAVNEQSEGIDLRIAISPVVWGEQIVIRLLDKSGTSMELEKMGYKGVALRTIRKGLQQPNGMILTSGPTGSGKSTSLYALIKEIKNDSINIVTLEDPVEYKMEGVNQIQVNPDVGLTFANGLRSILRQDPDVIMVGEIRDKETATLAVQASLTGHLVFSTLHTNSAAGILPRLLDMGVEPFLIASTVHTVIGQRLVRRIADDGKESYQSEKTETEAINETIGRLLPKKEEDIHKYSEFFGYESLPVKNQNAYTLFKGTDSPDTPNGYRGRMGLYEVFEVTEEIQNLIMKRSTSSEIQKVAQKQGMVTMREDGYLKSLEGLTTLAEVNRVAALDSA